MRLLQTICALAFALLSTVGSVQAQELRFNADHKFKIVQFTDVHWIYDDPASEEAAERMREVLDAERPDLVVYTGDIIFAKPAAPALQRALEPAIERGIPFAVTWGNHDDEHDMTRAELSAYIKDMKGNLTSHTEGISGQTNYTLSVRSSDGKRDAAVLYIFDSHSYSKIERVKGYDWIKHDQVAWYLEQSKAFTAANDGKPLPALAFMHIPLPEMRDMTQNQNIYMVGTRKEMVCAPEINTGLATAMLTAGDVMGLFVGTTMLWIGMVY